VSPPPATETSQEQLLGTTTGIIVTVIAAVAGLAALILPAFWAASPPDIRRLRAPRRPGKLKGAVPTGDQRSLTPRQGDNRQTGLAALAGDAVGGQGHWPSERLEDRHLPHRGNPHGKPSSWVLVAVVTAAFITGGLAIITHTPGGCFGHAAGLLSSPSRPVKRSASWTTPSPGAAIQRPPAIHLTTPRLIAGGTSQTTPREPRASGMHGVQAGDQRPPL
jgi:hypothetical protein